MIKRILATLAIAATIGTGVAACNSSYPAGTTQPASSFGPMASPSSSDSIQALPSDSVSPLPMMSVAPSAS